MMSKRLNHFILFAVFLALTGNCRVSAQHNTTTQNTLSPRQQSIVVIAGLTAIGELPRLQPALVNGLEAGMTVNEIKEVLVHLYAYCGFPRSIRGLQTFITGLDERKKKGISDRTGREASPITNQRPKYERGKKVLEQLTKQPETDPKRGYSAFSPEIDTFLKEHLFADLFERDLLSYADRELTTITVLASIGGVEPMLQSHLGICLNVGLTEVQLKQVFSLIGRHVGQEAGEAGQAVLTQVMSIRR